MTFKKRDIVVVNMKVFGQFQATVIEDFDTEKDKVARVETINGDKIDCYTEHCKFKLIEE